MAASKGLGQNGTLYTLVDGIGQVIRVENGKAGPTGLSLCRLIDQGGVIHLTQQNAADLIAVLQPFAATGNIS